MLASSGGCSYLPACCSSSIMGLSGVPFTEADYNSESSFPIEKKPAVELRYPNVMRQLCNGGMNDGGN